MVFLGWILVRVVFCGPRRPAWAQPGRRGLRRTEPRLNQGRVLSAPARQDRFVDALFQAHDGAQHDRMGVAFDDLLDQAIERRDRIGKDWGAGRERDPLRCVETAGSMHAAVSAEPMGERLMASGEQVDRECARLAG